MGDQALMVKENQALIKAIADVFREKKAVEEREKKLRAQLLEACDKYNILGFENDEMTVSYIPETTRDTFDSKAFKADDPDTYRLYTKTSKVKPSVRVTLK